MEWLDEDVEGVDPCDFLWRPDLFHEHELVSHKQPATRHLVQGQYKHGNGNVTEENIQSLPNEVSTSFAMSVCLSSCLSIFSCMTLEMVCGVLAVRLGLWGMCLCFQKVLSC